jgi:hypothetical protein
MYDPAIGRWFVSDPLAEAAPGWTPYRYGFNNPMRYTDPNGMHENEPHKKGKSGGFEFVKGGYGEMIEVGSTGYQGPTYDIAGNEIIPSMEITVTYDDGSTVKIVTERGPVGGTTNNPSRQASSAKETDSGSLPSIYDFKNGETVSYGGSDYVLHDNRWLPLMSKEVHAKYKKDYNNPKGGRPLTREEYAIVGYNIDLGINDGLRGALYGGWSGIIEKIATGKLNWSFITMFAGYTGGRLDAFEKMYERMKEHDRRVEHLREKDK